MSRLGAISTIFAAAASLNAEQTAPLHFFAAPMLKMNSPALRNEIEQRLLIERLELTKLHFAVMLTERMTNDECLMTKE